jgi:hypothetical protein
MRELADTHGFGHWTDSAIVLPHIVRSESLSADALAEMHRQLLAVGSAVWRRAFSLCVLAAMCAEAGHPGEGHRALASIGEAGRQGFLAPEMLRLEGELHLVGADADARAAERSFLAALDLARRRKERSLELRAALSLARLRRREGRDDDARRVVAEIYSTFTEGFTTADLTAAKAWLA